MKKVMIFDLCLLMMGWSLFLNGWQMAGGLAALLCALYNCCFVKKMNLWRLFSIFMTSTLIGMFFVLHSNIASDYQHIFPFLLLVMFDYALLNEVVCKLKAKKLMITYLFITFTTLFSTFTALLLPESPVLPYYRSDLLVFIFIIFFPTFVEMTVCLLAKMSVGYIVKEKLYN